MSKFLPTRVNRQHYVAGAKKAADAKKAAGAKCVFHKVMWHQHYSDAGAMFNLLPYAANVHTSLEPLCLWFEVGNIWW